MIPFIGKPTETENRLVVAREWREKTFGTNCYQLNVSVQNDGNVLELDNDNSGTPQ